MVFWPDIENAINHGHANNYRAQIVIPTRKSYGNIEDSVFDHNSIEE